ncbi:MAG: hypothetical protein DHS20C20_04850 [Ardenticatenaceae bacterium]|nr:MAG: hypothetical protein DHS20C20_04850 [Ardenticatenaceae bacterium]
MIKIEHKPQLLAIHKMNIGEGNEFFNYGFRIENGKATVEYVERFWRKTSRATMWKRELIYVAIQQHMPDDLVIPDDVIEKVNVYLSGYVISELNKATAATAV